ncbi:MAG: hypothetical protein GEV09_23630 [Pseudonocardiaceae bacterium]|nr:hypothetical protein [Pseudonocardiaceae bacterium]
MPRAAVVDTLRTAAEVVVPMAAQGVIARRPPLIALAERLQADDVGRVLAGSPQDFAPANLEKRGALSHFQPHGVLVSTGRARTERRRFNEAVLDTGVPLHQRAHTMVSTIRQEAALVSNATARTRVLGWDDFITAWRRIVRRVVLGDSARDDHELSDALDAVPVQWRAGHLPRSRARAVHDDHAAGHTLLDRHELRLMSPSRLDPPRPLPRTLDPFTLRFAAQEAPDG